MKILNKFLVREDDYRQKQEDLAMDRYELQRYDDKLHELRARTAFPWNTKREIDLQMLETKVAYLEAKIFGGNSTAVPVVAK